MAEMNNSSNSDQRALPAKAVLPKITGLSTAFPMEIESIDEPTTPQRGGGGGRGGRQPRRHESGH